MTKQLQATIIPVVLTVSGWASGTKLQAVSTNFLMVLARRPWLRLYDTEI